MTGGGSASSWRARMRSILVGAVAMLAPTAALAEALPFDPARETAVAALFDKARASPPALRIFLREMPKGGDLHNHLGGAIYAEDFLEWAGQRAFALTPAAPA